MFKSLSDDQIVQLACLGSLVFAVGLTSVSYWLGSARREAQGRLSANEKLSEHLLAARIQAEAKRKAA